MDTNTLGSERGLTFWRPRPPIGYASLGDCVTTGTMQPTFQVDPIITNMWCHLEAPVVHQKRFHTAVSL